MRTPLEDVLHTHPEIASEDSDAGRRLAVLFEAAEARENQYAAERLHELFQIAERALTLGAETAARPPLPPASVSWPMRITSVSAGLLLAATAPLMAETSLLLAALSGIAALAALVMPFGGSGVRQIKLPAPKADHTEAKLEAVASAADRALQAMVEPRRLPSPQAERPLGADEDILGLLQDALSVGRDAEDAGARELAENAERLARRMGYRPVYDGKDELFEVMLDPSVTAPLVLRPALVHEDKPDRTVFGVKVKGRAS
ncbi:hypothetical protein [Parvularcula oceani]|uniref:hypothetical protein n=1 Tax=Parvularcula oceani TaxID=1247963 RepID=UPI0004E0BF79|nr:hypothetical protein [Parvularcula oceani]